MARLGTALVTGGSRGIGREYAVQLARRGYDLMLVARDAARLEATAAELRETSRSKVDTLVADLAADPGLRLVEDVLARRTDIDLVVNNAGIGGVGQRFVDTTIDYLDALVALNVRGATRVARATAKAFSGRRRGTLINIASIAAVSLSDGAAAYAATRAYILHLSRIMGNELAASGIRVQAVLPGIVATDIWQADGIDVTKFPSDNVMSPEIVVSAGLAGLDLGEDVTVPSSVAPGDWASYDEARARLASGGSRDQAAPRYAPRR